MRRIGRLRSDASPSKVAVIGQPATAPITRRQPVPELPKSSGPAGAAKPPTPTPSIRQSPVADALDTRAERAHGLGGVEHILAFEQPGDPGLADRERAEDQRAVRDRLVARHARAPRERAAAPGGQRGWPATCIMGISVRLRAKLARCGRCVAPPRRARGAATRERLLTEPGANSQGENRFQHGKDCNPWQSQNSVLSDCARIAVRSSTTSTAPRSSARNAAPCIEIVVGDVAAVASGRAPPPRRTGRSSPNVAGDPGGRIRLARRGRCRSQGKKKSAAEAHRSRRGCRDRRRKPRRRRLHRGGRRRGHRRLRNHRRRHRERGGDLRSADLWFQVRGPDRSAEGLRRSCGCPDAASDAGP